MVTNGDGARVREAGQNLLRAGTDVLAPILSDGAATYVPGVSERRAGATSYLHGGDKNAEARTSSAGAVTGTRSYDAFGGTLASTGWQGPAGYGGAFGYREDGTNFRLVGHRLYDPTAGRFLSRDPARDGSNWYAYCEGDPVNGADPEGLFFKEIGAIGGMAATGAVVGSIGGPPGMLAGAVVGAVFIGIGSMLGAGIDNKIGGGDFWDGVENEGQDFYTDPWNGFPAPPVTKLLKVEANPAIAEVINGLFMDYFWKPVFARSERPAVE